MGVGQRTPIEPARRKRTAFEKIAHLHGCVKHACIRAAIKDIYKDLRQAPWFARQRLRQLDVRILAHGGKTGAGITRPRERRAGDPPYKNKADAAERRWQKLPAAEA